MRRWLAIASLLLAGGLHAQETVIRVDVNLVRVVATVKDASGRPVGSLDKKDFTILDNGVPQEIAVFERRTGQPLSVAVLIDISGSTAKDLKYETESIARFLKALFGEGKPQDTAALYSFNWAITKLNHFTHNYATLEHSLRALKAEGGTSLYDAIYLAAHDIEDREGRKVLVVVTDGGDTTSSKDFHAALEAAQLADAIIYAILVVPITNEAGRNIGGENALATLGAGTGGQVFSPTIGARLDAAFSDILKDLRTQYLLGYYPKDVPVTKNRFHKLDVRISRPDLRVLARSGYYGGSESQTEPSGGKISVVPPVKQREK